MLLVKNSIYEESAVRLLASGKLTLNCAAALLNSLLQPPCILGDFNYECPTSPSSCNTTLHYIHFADASVQSVLQSSRHQGALPEGPHWADLESNSDCYSYSLVTQTGHIIEINTGGRTPDLNLLKCVCCVCSAHAEVLRYAAGL